MWKSWDSNPGGLRPETPLATSAGVLEANGKITGAEHGAHGSPALGGGRKTVLALPQEGVGEGPELRAGVSAPGPGGRQAHPAPRPASPPRTRVPLCSALLQAARSGKGLRGRGGTGSGDRGTGEPFCGPGPGDSAHPYVRVPHSPRPQAPSDRNGARTPRAASDVPASRAAHFAPKSEDSDWLRPEEANQYRRPVSLSPPSGRWGGVPVRLRWVTCSHSPIRVRNSVSKVR